jgi:hypothetical protein
MRGLFEASKISTSFQEESHDGRPDFSKIKSINAMKKQKSSNLKKS